MTPREDAAVTMMLVLLLALALVGVCVAVRAGWDKLRDAPRPRRSSFPCGNPSCALCNPHPVHR